MAYCEDEDKDHTGKVHNVGYRIFLTNLACELGMDRFNAFDSLTVGALTVLLDCREGLVDEFRRRIEAEKGAESMACEPYEGSVPPIERCMLFFQVEQFGRAISIVTEWLEKHDAMPEKQDMVLQEPGASRELKLR